MRENWHRACRLPRQWRKWEGWTSDRARGRRAGGGRNKLVVDGHSVEREMHCWVKAERSQGKIARVQDAKSGRAEGRPEHSIDLVGEFQRRANQHREIPSDRNARPTDEALQRLGTCDTTKHVLTARGGDQRVTVTQVSMQ